MGRYINSVPQICDGNGKPIANAKKFFFEPGTTTKKTIYSDSGLSVFADNPQLSDANGRYSDIFLDGIYKEEQQDNTGTLSGYDGATLWTRDPIGDIIEGQWELWTNDNTYNIPEIVLGSDDEYYRSLSDGNQGNDPTTSPTAWEQLEVVGHWNTNITYNTNDLVLRNGLFYRSLTDSNSGNDPLTDTTNWGSTVSTASEIANNLTFLFHPDISRGHEDFYKSGVFPTSFNQQWGGVHYGGQPDGSTSEVAASSIITDTTINSGNATTSDDVAIPFYVGQAITVEQLNIKISKTGNPTDNLGVFIYDDSAGSPNALITNGTATAQSGQIHTDNADGEVTVFTFATSPNLLANTKYWVVIARSGAIDAANYWKVFVDSTMLLYPSGTTKRHNGTSWVDQTVNGYIQVVPTEAGQVLQSGGLFSEGKIVPFEGTPLNQSGGFYTANDNFINHRRGSFVLSGSSFTKDKTVLDVGTGTDNNRIVLRCNVTTGYMQLDVYEDDETKHTLTSTIDASAIDCVVGFGYRAENDGSDYIWLQVNSETKLTSTSLSLSFNESFGDYGHTRIGSGFSIAPTWTDNEDMSVLPSASGWTWSGTGTESSCMAVSGGILYQIGSGYGSTDNGYYSKTTTLNNTTGWVVETKLKIKSDPNSAQNATARIHMLDGTRELFLNLHEYFIDTWYGGAYGAPIQVDLASQSVVLKIIGKGNDFFVYADNKLIFDGTGLNTTSTATNEIRFGDQTATAGQNANVEWHYFKYYEGAYLPEYTSGEISELSCWSDDISEIMLTIYNSGTIQSVKALAGMDRNYVREVEYSKTYKGIEYNPTYTSSTPTSMPDMNAFVLGTNITGNVICAIKSSSVGAWVRVAVAIDGNFTDSLDDIMNYISVSNHVETLHAINEKNKTGMTFINAVWYTSTATMTGHYKQRKLIVKAK